MTENNISLSKIIENIESTHLLKEILDQYHKALTDEYQYEIPVLVPVLNTRIASCVAANLVMENTRLKAVKDIEGLSIQIKQSLATFASLLAVATASNYDTKINYYVTNNFKIFKPLAVNFSTLFLNFNTQIFKESEIDFKDLQTIVKKLIDLIDHKIYEEDWLIAQLEDVNKELKTFARRTYDKKWRIELATIFDQFRNEHNKIIEQTEYILNRKFSNPLISDQLVNLAKEVEQQFKVILTQFNTAINSIYRYECETERINTTIKNYLFLSNKITKKSDRH